MIELAGYTFDDHKACIVCRHVCEAFPVLAFAHDRDGDIHFTCGAVGHEADDWNVIGLSHLLDQVRSMGNMPLVEAGFEATRSHPGAGWELAPLSEA
jgi:hypothetical protein